MRESLPGQTSDQAVMRAVQAGQVDCFGLLVQRYQAALRRVALSRLGNLELAEDIVQETFLAVYASRHTFQLDGNFRTWLWTILLNRCRKHYLRQSGKSEQIPWSQLGAQVAFEPAAEPQLPGFENSELLESALQKLPEAVADALRLRFFGQLSFAEIAETVACSLGTAKNRVRQGLLQMSHDLRSAEHAENAAPAVSHGRILSRDE